MLKITVEGDRASGKTVLAKLVYDTLIASGYAVAVAERGMGDYMHEKIYDGQPLLNKRNNDGRRVKILVPNPHVIPELA